MKLFIHSKPNARENKVEKIDETNYKVSVTEPAVNDRANRAIVRLLADYLRIAPSQIEIVSGHTSRQKVVMIY